MIEGALSPALAALAVVLWLAWARALTAGGVTLPSSDGAGSGADRSRRNRRRVLATAARLARVTMLPRFLAARAERRRRAAIDSELPQFLDALAATSTAGLSAPLGIRRAADVLRGPLREELGAALRAVDFGARWRDELRALAERTDLPDLRRAVAVITRTDTLGSSLAASTAELAQRVREARRQRTTERARTAPVKMLFPLVFLVLPAFLLLTVVPVLLTTLRSIR
ncbi:MAG: type II secretion system F family protein [Actinobacteria bacterium]|nr:type II secretion system F family protein [Actinomycetota bacterium]